MNIYTEIPPTYLYIKQHSITGLKYFGKTSQSDPVKYLGSGTRWTRHYKKYGKSHVKTLWVSDPYYDTSIVEHALHFSYENNIVESDDWANLKLENGLDGNPKGNIVTPETRIKISIATSGAAHPLWNKHHTIESNLKNSESHKTIDYIKKYSDSCLTVFGYSNPSLCPLVKNKRESTNIERFGFSNAMKAPEVKLNYIASINAKYNCNNISQSPEIKNKKAITRRKSLLALFECSSEDEVIEKIFIFEEQYNIKRKYKNCPNLSTILMYFPETAHNSHSGLYQIFKKSKFYKPK